MRKWILVLFTVSSALATSAQVQFGLKAGLNIANFTTSGMIFFNRTTFSSRADFNGGLMVSLPLHSGFFLQPELIYSGQGQNLNSYMVTNPTINYNYLNLPVLFKYQHVSGLFVETGPQIGFLLSAKQSFNGNTFDVKKESQSVDFSWAFGIGYKPQNIPVGIDLRYNLGLTNVDRQAGLGNAKNSVFQIDVFYMFGRK